MKIEQFKPVFIKLCTELHPNKNIEYQDNEYEAEAFQLLIDAINNSIVPKQDMGKFIKYVISSRYKENAYGTWDNRTYDATSFVKSFGYFEHKFLHPSTAYKELSEIQKQWLKSNQKVKDFDNKVRRNRQKQRIGNAADGLAEQVKQLQQQVISMQEEIKQLRAESVAYNG